MSDKCYCDSEFAQMPIFGLWSKLALPGEDELRAIQDQCGSPATLWIIDNGVHGSGCEVKINLNPTQKNSTSVLLGFEIPQEMIPVLAEVFGYLAKLQKLTQ